MGYAALGDDGCVQDIDLTRTQGGTAKSSAAAEPIVERVVVLLAVLTVSLWVASGLHLAGLVQGQGRPFDAAHAGIAEALIGVVLAVGAGGLWRAGSRGRTAGLWATGFAIAGFCWGLSITSRGGHWSDIAYHLVGLSLLTGCFMALLRTGGTTVGRSWRRR